MRTTVQASAISRRYCILGGIRAEIVIVETNVLGDPGMPFLIESTLNASCVNERGKGARCSGFEEEQ
jgi:hypothetical protein